VRIARPTAPAAVTAAAVLLVSTGVVGTDIRWMVPLGAAIVHGGVPDSIPFAAAPTHGWHDVPALAELVTWAAYSSLGERGLLLLQIGAVILGWSMLARGLRRQGSSEGSAALVCLLVLVGSLPQLVVTRSYLFSLALFPLLVYLLEEESRVASRRIWLAVPLLAVWSNLHGAVLLGFLVLLIYLALARLRRDPYTTAGVAAAAACALFATPALASTGAYYRRVFENESAREHVGLWAPLNAHGFGRTLIACGAIALVLAARGGLRRWEAVALALLAAATIRLARTEPLFLFLAAYPVARGLRVSGPGKILSVVAFVGLTISAIATFAVGPADVGAKVLAKQAAQGRLPVLADALVAEQVALEGGVVWVGNPLDAFRASDQRLWLDWIQAKPGGKRAVSRAALIIVSADSPQGRAARRDDRLRLIRRSDGYALYRRS
jgi:hypothetical protein